jgi:hypothetical protein
VLTISLAAEPLLTTVVPLASRWPPKRLIKATDPASRLSELQEAAQSAAWSTCKLARRCRYDQHRRQKTSLPVGGSLVTGLVDSVKEAKSSNATRWVITVFAKPSIAA